jgi:hypothetical protein
MLLNDSYNHKEVNRQINEAVGNSYSLIERLKMRGNGSPRIKISESSPEIERLLRLDNNTDWCYMELRPKGIIIRFRSLLETYALVIPYWKLVVYKTDSDRYTLYKDQFFVRIFIQTNNEKAFVKRVLELKGQEIPKEI